MVLATIVLFAGFLVVNEWLFLRFEYAPGINWVYLPAGMRLVCTLLFGGAGAIGLLIVSWLVSFLHFFPHDPVRAFVGGLIGAGAPYLVYILARRRFGLQASLVNLTSRRLLVCILAYSVASPLLHHLWFFIHGDRGNLAQGLLAMFIGDLLGTLIVVYAMKALVSRLPLPARRRSPHPGP
jgi:hypothetical protein